MSTVHPERSITERLPFQTIKTPASRVAFYSAIALPALYMPLLVTGIETLDGLALFLGLFGVHILSLAAGRSYQREA